ncbi:MAG: hypothetical protein JW779_10925 [Candidatus Thorarchaeota archaeon]|nr:hypothetical protein [Candidatus Thorarchaeota archaeon]
MLAEPKDFIGNILAKLINRFLEDSSQYEKVKKWNMTVVVETDYYPVTLIFGDSISIQRGIIENPTLVFVMNFKKIISLAKKETSILGSLIHGSIKTKGILKHPRAAFRFYRLMDSILK